MRRKRRQAVEIAEALTQTIFNEMFGDWSKRGDKSRLCKLGDRLDFMTSGSRGWASHYSENGDIFLRIQNVRRDHLDLGEIVYVNAPQTAEAIRTRVRPGDVLLSITADLGRTAVVPEGLGPAYINQHLSILRSSKLEPRFVSAALCSPGGQRAIQRRNREGVKVGLNFDDVRSIEIPDADRTQQRLFAQCAASVDTLMSRQIAAVAKADSLFASLQHRAFRGEL